MHVVRLYNFLWENNFSTILNNVISMCDVSKDALIAISLQVKFEIISNSTC